MSENDPASVPKLPEASLAPLAPEVRQAVRLLEALAESLRKRVTELEHRLNQDSSNSSRPPSSDTPAARAKRRRKKKRKKGDKGKDADGPEPKRGPPEGHRGHHRALLELSEINEVVALYPEQCLCCGAALGPSQCNRERRPERVQQVDWRDGRVVKVEYQLYRRWCRCGAATRASLPDGVRRSAFGSGLKAVVTALAGAYRISRRNLQSLVHELFGVSVSLGSIDKILSEATESLEEPTHEVRDAIRAEAAANMDETRWFEGAGLVWLWVMVGQIGIYFHISDRRNREAALELLGNDFPGTLGTDAYVVYWKIGAARWQLCWAHILRHLQSLVERGGADAEIGQAALVEVGGLFAAWHLFLADPTISRDDLRRALAPVRMRFKRILLRGLAGRGSDSRRLCKTLLKYWSALFTFIDVEGVEPTNNVSERELRFAVIWRKTSLGTQSARGSKFVARMLTARATLRRHGRNLLDYFRDLFEARARGQPSPSPLPAPT